MRSDPQPLRDDVRLLGETLRVQGGDALFEAVEKVRAAAITARDGGEPDVDAWRAFMVTRNGLAAGMRNVG